MALNYLRDTRSAHLRWDFMLNLSN